MKKTFTLAVAAGAALALSACGSSDDAATEAEADTVEIPAEEAVAEVEEEPVMTEPAANAGEDDTVVEASQSEQEAAETAGTNAADVAARARAAREAAERATEAAEETIEEVTN